MLGTREQFLPQEEMLETAISRKKMSIGLPRENTLLEKRIALIPSAVKTLVQHGQEIIIEKGAGEAAHFTDHAYSEAGALMAETPQEVYKAEVILKVAPITHDEIGLLRDRQKLMSVLHLSHHNKEYFRKLILKRVTAIAYENIRDKTNASPVVRSISEIAGTTSIQIAAEYLSHEKYGNGVMFGGFTGIAPSEVVILGAGTVGEYAARMALGMGALVKIFDNSIYKLRQFQSRLHQTIFTSTIQIPTLKTALKTADVLICAIHSNHHRSPIIVTEEMVAQMKPGSVIVDVSIDQGGCVETSRMTTHNNPVFVMHGVTHYCVPNIASRVPQTASIALSNFFEPLLLDAADMGGLDKLIESDYYFRQGVYLFNGILTNKNIGEFFDLPYQNIDLLMAAYH